MPGRRLDALMPQRLLRLADILPGQLRAHETAEVVGFDVGQAQAVGVLLHCLPGAGWIHGAGQRALRTALEAGEDDRVPGQRRAGVPPAGSWT
jgi:hypothetical protein